MTTITVKDKITILAGAIRSQAREFGYNPEALTKRQAEDFGEAQGHRTDTIAGQFYRNCTDVQWQKVLKELGIK